MHPAIIIGTVRSLIVDVAMGQIPRSTERISSNTMKFKKMIHQTVCFAVVSNFQFFVQKVTLLSVL